ncbi:arginyl-tRNA synthetase [Catenulispora acidiphila DSM 44928]|uniref:Arginine--tRNA ligase n=1 Tax=Catenulispora acidiphila (strain DSM 44928 / JCM 14897 / NBRC 102108 / NRRL B-24433 / ID139908) TaxID=479433 RepID=C7QAW0_CATAD|nr:arginine--tRNA ligase [Catenulispora acidiphila]ACU74433.1 arginyl-tRNA synthetase [Catenulispora acidiphila DSM 44928]
MAKALSEILADDVRAALTAVLGDAARGADPLIRPSDHADFQANGVLPLAKAVKGNPRELAMRVAAVLVGSAGSVGSEGAPDSAGAGVSAEGETEGGEGTEPVVTSGVIAAVDVAGPGFLNLTLTDAALAAQAAERLGDPRLGVAPTGVGRTAVIDYSQPNIAKEMHVGHLRSTVIGDALVRLLEFDGRTVVRQNHLGDWGTQFGMLIQYLVEHPEARPADAEHSGEVAISWLTALYRDARAHFESDAEFADRARKRVVTLQGGDEESLEAWREMVAESKRYFEDVYGRLDVRLVDADAVGESFYNPYLAEVAADLEERGIAVWSEGALCVFFDDIKGPDGDPVPLMVRKSDGGYGYAATDLAAVRYRVNTLKADEILYVVDSRQALHFRMVFETARRAGYLPEGVEAVHVQFGSVLGTDGKPFKTRAGKTIRLIELLDSAVDHAVATVEEKNPDLAAADARTEAKLVGIGAVKYADLSTSRTKDYIFDLDRMVSLHGNTSVYLQYAHARIHSILRKLPPGTPARIHTDLVLEPAERKLALHLDDFGATLATVTENFEPHRLATYLYALAQTFSDFYENCPVLKAPTDAVRENRAALVQLTGETLKAGLALLGISAPDQL